MRSSPSHRRKGLLPSKKQNLQVPENASTANDIVKNLVVDFPAESSSPDLEAAKFAILTDRAKIPAEKIEELGPLYGKYLKP